MISGYHENMLFMSHLLKLIHVLVKVYMKSFSFLKVFIIAESFQSLLQLLIVLRCAM